MTGDELLVTGSCPTENIISKNSDIRNTLIFNQCTSTRKQCVTLKSEEEETQQPAVMTFSQTKRNWFL